MLTKVYVDNYKSLVNFTADFRSIQLIIGPNGSGKTTLLEVLQIIREFVINGRSTVEVFPAQHITRWQMAQRQRFEIQVQRGNHFYHYEVVIDHGVDPKRGVVLRESLQYDTGFLFAFDAGNVHLYQDDLKQIAEFPAQLHRSALANVAPRNDNTLLVWFKNWLSQLYIVDIDPRQMTSRAEQEEEFPNATFANFSSWFRWLLQERPEMQSDLYDSLSECIDGFESLPLVQFGGTTRILSMRQRIQGVKKPIELTFDELSFGQKKLIALYTLLHYGAIDGRTICIDEPDNYIGLREIQPWLAAIQDVQMESSLQILLISHHPEIINYMGSDCGLLMQRENGGPARIGTVPTSNTLGFSPAELIARGWFNVE